jgi:hypothetical protein
MICLSLAYAIGPPHPLFAVQQSSHGPQQYHVCNFMMRTANENSKTSLTGIRHPSPAFSRGRGGRLTSRHIRLRQANKSAPGSEGHTGERSLFPANTHASFKRGLEFVVRILLWAFWTENREFSSVDRRTRRPEFQPRPLRFSACNRQKGNGKLVHRPGLRQPGLRFIMSVYRRRRISHRAFFEHFGFPAPEKIWWFSSGSISRRGDSHEEDGSSARCNSGTSKRCLNLFLC